MINSSDSYNKAIVAATRQIVVNSLINLVDPDIVYGNVTSSMEMQYSVKEQIHDLIFEPEPPRVTLELNRWLLNGKQKLYRSQDNGEQGWISAGLSDESCNLSDVWVQLNVSNLSVLQACAVYFTGDPLDGIANDFIVSVYSGETLAWSQTITGNTERAVYFEGFTAYDVTAIRVTPTKWSNPFHRARIIEIVPGIYEEWDGHTIYSVDVIQQVDFSGLSLPYGTASFTIRNDTRRFDPTNKAGLFQSIEERQAIPISFGVVMDDGTEFKPVGTFYQQTGGWRIESNGLLIKWSLVDIIGMIAHRKYEVPAELPTTLSGWMASIVLQLGENFADRYLVDDTLGTTVLICTKDSIENVTCGDLLRWICQASGAYPVADAETGYLSAKKINDSVTRNITLRELNDYPSISANTDLAAIIFKIGEEQYVVGGTNAAADKTVSVSNPFITTVEQANIVAQNILVNYGGTQITARGRGDMANEVGDVNSVEIVPGVDMSGRRYKQQFRIADGVMTNVPAYFVQATGITLYRNFDVFTEDGTWKAPDGVTSATLVLVGGGAGGEPGTDGTWEADGEPGAGGKGGKVWFSTISLNAGQVFDVKIGLGGSPGNAGGATTAGSSYSSANGQYFNGYAIMALGSVYGIDGEDGSGKNAQQKTGNGGGGGAAGTRGLTGWDGSSSHIGRYPTPGGLGGIGGSGIAVIYYDK